MSSWKWLRPLGLVLPAMGFLVFAEYRVAEANSHNYVLENHPRSADRQFLHDCLTRSRMLLRDHKEYDEPTYRRIMKLAESPDHETSLDAFGILWTMGESVHRKEILKLGRKFAASKDEFRAFDGICLLQGFGDSSWKAFALRFKDSRSEIMRDLANEVGPD